MNTKLESIKKELKDRGIKPTLIRLKIMDYLLKNHTHPTAEDIYLALEKDIPTISRTSVYNTLNMFSEKSLVVPLVLTGTETRYDGKLSSHHHLLCEKCGKIIDLDIECQFFKKKMCTS